MLDFFQIVVIYANQQWRQVGAPWIFDSGYQVNFAGLWVRLKIEQQKYTMKILLWLYNHPLVL